MEILPGEIFFTKIWHLLYLIGEIFIPARFEILVLVTQKIWQPLPHWWKLIPPNTFIVEKVAEIGEVIVQQKLFQPLGMSLYMHAEGEKNIILPLSLNRFCSVIQILNTLIFTELITLFNYSIHCCTIHSKIICVLLSFIHRFSIMVFLCSLDTSVCPVHLSKMHHLDCSLYYLCLDLVHEYAATFPKTRLNESNMPG